MIESWWSAHVLEFVVWGVITAVAGVVWFFAVLGDAWQERKKKRKDGIL